VRAEQLQASARLKNIKVKNETAEAEARSRFTLAKTRLECFKNVDGGMFLIQLTRAKTRAAADARRVERLRKAADPSAAGQIALEDAEVQLAFAEAEVASLTRGDYQRRRLQLEHGLQDAKWAVNQVMRDSESQLAAAEAEKAAADRVLSIRQEQLDRLQDQLARCTVTAPHDCVATLSSVLRPGDAVRTNQPLVTLTSAPTSVERVRENVLVIPRSALQQAGERSFCFVLANRGVERRPILTGDRNERGVQIVEGLDPGECVIRDAAGFLTERMEGDEVSRSAGEGHGPHGAKEDVRAAPTDTPTGADETTDQPAAKRPGAGRAGRARGRGPGLDLSQFDKDGDGRLSREEAPEQMASFFRRLDVNADGFLDAAELAAMRSRMRGVGPGGPGRPQEKTDPGGKR
jgi:hypothetical protein